MDEILEIQDQISGLVIEFHDVDLHLERLDRFLSALNHTLVHVHANNYAEASDDGIPLSIEMTFSSHLAQERCPKLPSVLDFANDPTEPEYKVKFWES